MSLADADAAFLSSIATHRPEAGAVRVEVDGLGPREIPADAYWGINASRALENFAISGRPIAIFPDLIHGYACVKQAAARANAELGVLPPERADLIDRACEEIKAGRLRDQFVVDIVQGGAGTSTNMNLNEVIANRGLELAGHPKGAYAYLDPNDDVNKGQSTNDTYPTALKLGLRRASERYLAELLRLELAFAAKAEEFGDIVKVGRTELMDAVPMTLGQEFSGFADALAEEHDNLEQLLAKLGTVNLGGTAIGTGIAADPQFPETVRRHLEQITGHEIRTAPNLVHATTDVGVFVDLSSSLKATALKLGKICNDLRLLGSGPQAGLAEITLPARQAGSSIMPGKVNPVIPEVVNEIVFAVVGADVTVAMAAEAGQLQLNAFEPIMAASLFQSLTWLTAGCMTLRVNCVDGIAANTKHLAQQVSSFVGVVTALIPRIGYANATRLAHVALTTNANIADVVVAEGLLTPDEAEELLSPAHLTRFQEWSGK